MTESLRVGPLAIGAGRPFVLIAGPCVIEPGDRTLRIAEALVRMWRGPLIFKASFDKANRSSVRSFRGPGLDQGLEVLALVKRELGVCITTDVHSPDQIPAVAQVADLLQIPAFLCRQTDLLVAAAASGRPVNVKKGQFMAPWDMGGAVEKAGGPGRVMLTERGSSFGYNGLVTDLRSLPQMRALGVPVCLDATHSVQQPGGLGDRTGGDRAMAPVLARAGVAAGLDALFMEVHDDPDQALSDGPNMLRLDALPALLDVLVALDQVVKS